MMLYRMVDTLTGEVMRDVCDTPAYAAKMFLQELIDRNFRIDEVQDLVVTYRDADLSIDTDFQQMDLQEFMNTYMGED